MTPKGTPRLGRSPKRNLFLNVGHGHIGWTMSMGSARAVADIVAGKAPGIDLSGLTLADARDGDWHAGAPHPPRRPELRVRGRHHPARLLAALRPRPS